MVTIEGVSLAVTAAFLRGKINLGNEHVAMEKCTCDVIHTMDACVGTAYLRETKEVTTLQRGYPVAARVGPALKAYATGL